MAVESYSENNITAAIATSSVPLERRGASHYWLGLASLDDLRTNTLESAAGTLVSQYSGKTMRKRMLSRGKKMKCSKYLVVINWYLIHLNRLGLTTKSSLKISIFLSRCNEKCFIFVSHSEIFTIKMSRFW